MKKSNEGMIEMLTIIKKEKHMSNVGLPRIIESKSIKI